ncbi:MAG: hypothetical protein KGJ34_01770, partial [Patescibacteria group bacterium]|nr:hypothetical protein [Patescibacteria group bacterium]
MARYLLGYRIEGSIRILNPGRRSLDFQFRGFDIKIPTTVDTDASHFECFLSSVEAKNLIKANDIGNEIISEFLDNASFVIKTSLFTIGMAVVLKDETDEAERVVFRKLYWEEDQNPLHIRENAPESQTIRELLVKAEASDDYLLALRWLRYSYRARGYIEQFTYNWLALERLV